MRVCDACVHAAFDDGGVWCKAFGESIFDSHVAEECGMYEENGHIPTLSVVRPQGLSREAERRLVMAVSVEFFGKREQGDKLADNIANTLRVRFGQKITVDHYEVDPA